MSLSKSFVFIMIMCIGPAWCVDEAQYYLEKANGYFSRGNLDEAATYYEHAVNSDPELFFLISGNGNLEKLLEDPSRVAASKAEQMCLLLLEKKYKDCFIYFYLGWAQLNLLKKRQAIRHLEKARRMMKLEGIRSNLIRKLIKAAHQLNTSAKKPQYQYSISDLSLSDQS
ncbi:MAG: hypothetical protein JW774_11575 [Candidatus Aureabacteria bacterium]|nr:hypothetical protein [Candidatus Auribacterota bacterium]